MALMNSTVSHEMRNPLNAVVSHVSRQEEQLHKIRSIIDENIPDCEPKQQLQAVLQEQKKSIAIAKSSTKMIAFNVEDILALPQLKAGKFTRDIKKADLKKAVGEVISIMEFQAAEKQI
jgi:signal transduction histidine kinase